MVKLMALRHRDAALVESAAAAVAEDPLVHSGGGTRLAPRRTRVALNMNKKALTV